MLSFHLQDFFVFISSPLSLTMLLVVHCHQQQMSRMHGQTAQTPKTNSKSDKH